MPEYDGSEEESTARHEIPQPQPLHLTVDLRGSQPEVKKSDPPAKKQFQVTLAQGATLVGLALASAVAALIQRGCH